MGKNDVWSLEDKHLKNCYFWKRGGGGNEVFEHEHESSRALRQTIYLFINVIYYWPKV